VSGAATMVLPTWIERLPRRPMCDVPWLGRSVILSDGDVHFCCFSEAVVGNVNQAPLQEIWRGEKMRKIRESLVKHVLPPECRSNACPFFRGDEHHYILDRMHGGRDVVMGGATDVRRRDRGWIGATALTAGTARVARGERLRLTLAPSFDGGVKDWLALDAFVGVTFPDGRVLFLPELTEYPLPCTTNVVLDSARRVGPFDLLDTTIGPEIACGNYEFCAALVYTTSDPMIPANCLWSQRLPVAVTETR